MDYTQAFAALEALDRRLVLLEHIASVLSWDQETMLSPLGLEERATQLGYLAQERHSLLTSERMGELLALCDPAQADSPFEQALIRIRRREYERSRRVDGDLVRSISEQAAKTHESWVAARKASDWDLFSKDFAAMVSLIREKADSLKGEGESRYDALLDTFEEGMKKERVSMLFSVIRNPLISLTKRMEGKAVDSAFLYENYPIPTQEAFAKQVLTDMGFDFQRGRMAVAVHPFTSTLGSDDIRITTRYTDPSVMDSFYSSIHEGGHALYEMGASSGRLKGTSLANGASLGMHESQSRLWENMIGKNPSFWEHYYPIFKSMFPTQTEGIDLVHFVKAINTVKRSPIRVNADEVSYSLHIMLRFELEQLIVDDALDIADIPTAWNEKHRELLGFVPSTLAQGVLQDVHWSSGDFGYFPTYALGNLYGAQIWQHLGEKLPLDTLLRQGELLTLSSALRNEIYERGALDTGLDTLQRVTRKPLDAAGFTSYLENKFSRIFG